MEKRKVTRKDIASRAGTSVSVVSRALNNSGYVAKEKRERILSLAEEMNYIPNSVSIFLQERRTKQILFYCKDLSNAFNIQMYQGMIETAYARGYMVLVNGAIAFEEIKDTLVDGIITSNQAVAKYYMENVGKNYRLPVVSASYSDVISIPKPLPIVEVDMFQVVESALDYLYQRGHRKIAIGMPYPIEDFNARARAYIAWVKEKELYDPSKYYIGVSRRNPQLIDDRRLLGFHEEVGNLLEIQEDFYGKGRLAAHIFMEKNLDATAILGFNDDFSLGLIKGFQELGVRVPEDISVLGFDGINNRKYVTPLLTTMGLFPEKQGAKCVEVLLDIIEGKKYKHINHTGFKLLEGGSVRTIKEGH